MTKINEPPPEIKKHINRLEKIRKDFVANVSHELRTPLTVLRGYLETLINQNNEALSNYQEIFKKMHRQSLRMEDVVNDLLTLSRLEIEEDSESNKTVVNVSNMLTTYCMDLEKINANKEHLISLEIEPNLAIYGHENELKSVFSNIIVNAVKYTPTKGSIFIQWVSKKDQAIFSVRDSGIGIAEKDIARITERFYRVDKARSRDSGGTGLGLAIVKHVLSRHHAQLKITSKLGKGSTFCCIFPKDPTQNQGDT